MTTTNVYLGQQKKRYPVKSVARLDLADDGSVTRTVLGGRKRKRRVSKQYRWMDKALRRASRAQEVAASEYGRRHARSNRRKKNGAVRDLPKNMLKAQRKGMKKMKIRIL
ncbi:MAG: hypothetical protein R2844_00975 [Caldilineales bacterium]